MNHFLPIPFFLIAMIVLVIGNKYKFKGLQIVSKIVITISLIAFVYLYTKYLGYDILKIITSILF